MVIIDKFSEIKDKFPNKIAFIEDKNFKTNTLTFAELYLKSVELAKYFRKQGIKKGMHVTVLITMSIDLYATLIAIWMIGAIPVFFDVSAEKEYIEKCTSIIKPEILVGNTITLLYAKINKICIDAKHINIKHDEYIIENEDFNYAKGIEDQGAMVTFTSGTTGIPKTVVRTHKFLLEQYEVIRDNLHYSSEHIDLGILPVFTLANIATGITTVIPNTQLKNMAKINTKNLVKQIETHKISSATISPTVLAKILDYAKFNNYSLESLKMLHIGGGPVFPKLLSRIKNLECQAFVVYGSSEAEPISILSWEEMLSFTDKIESGKGLPVGKIIPDIKLKIIQNDKIVDTTNKSIKELETNIGEIIVAGKNVLKGYLNGIGDEENKIKENGEVWHKTGDCGFIEDDILWLVGRKNNYIIRDNNIVYSLPLQALLSEKYNIYKSAYLDYKNTCYLILESSDTERARNIKKETLKRFNIDKTVFMDKIPMDKRHNAKVDINKIKEYLNKK